MLNVLVILAAIAPVAVVIWYIYRKDRKQPEPTKLLIKAFIYGILSALLTLVIVIPFEAITEFANDEVSNIGSAIFNAFFMAAIPEELAKLVMLWLLLRKNPHFDEKFDGIVYAVCIGMGFAGIENVMYLAGGIEDGSWISIGISRALFSIPGHFLFAVLMGYYYSLYYWGIDRSLKAKTMILVAPVLAHGLFDGILFCMNVDEGLAVICLFLFLYFFNKLKKRGKERIESLMNQ